MELAIRLVLNHKMFEIFEILTNTIEFIVQNL